MFLGIFDGHGGEGAAIYIANNLVGFIEESLDWQEYLTNHTKDPIAIGQMLENIFLSVDTELRAHQSKTTGYERDCSGCTSVTCMVTPTHIICANAGDSRCVLGSDGRTIPMSFDHKPNNKDETSRIIKAGGTVQWYVT